jgi:hypothetical protein
MSMESLMRDFSRKAKKMGKGRKNLGMEPSMKDN